MCEVMICEKPPHTWRVRGRGVYHGVVMGVRGGVDVSVVFIVLGGSHIGGEYAVVE